MYNERMRPGENAEVPDLLSPEVLRYIAYSINAAGGGGNLKELFNPNYDPNNPNNAIKGLAEELVERGTCIPFYQPNKLPPSSTACCVCRLGRPGVKADKHGSEAADGIVRGLEVLAQQTNKPFPRAIFPVEATAGQLARAARTVLATTERNLCILDIDVCGGMAVPAVPLAFNIFQLLTRYPQVAVIQLEEKGDRIYPNIELLETNDPFFLERTLRDRAANSQMGAVWFAWLMCDITESPLYFTPGAITSSIIRGRIVCQALEECQNPDEAPLKAANALLKAGEITQIIGLGRVNAVIDESYEAPGFAQYSYRITMEGGGGEGEIIMAARNEYIVVYTKGGRIIAKAPNIISAIGPNGPKQSHTLQPGDKIAIVTARPQALITYPDGEREWMEQWRKYWESERKQGTWNHPY